ncbi:hypothetical protein UFOVP1090_16 [uncultured Caudovirales phage]|uniref:Uncharacterized protein n=1 Tax=uncultured Caudovirales phage TaxID=2100421 RepID=A0A6J5QG13_9CAUD|nr:hypothetical protein UFOVP1090_16 [uncultured Caudovirales phage]
MQRVFVIQEQKDKNLLPAEKFGEITVILCQRDLERGIDHCIDKLSTAMQDIDSRTDSLILVGKPLMIAIGFHIALHYGDGKVSALNWDPIHYKYIRETISL